MDNRSPAKDLSSETGAIIGELGEEKQTKVSLVNLSKEE